MPLGMEVGLSPRDFVFDGDPAPPQKKGHSPHSIFDPCPLWPNGWMDKDTTWYGSRPRPRPHCVRRGPSSPAKGAQQLSLFSTHVYCGHGRPSQLLLSSCTFCTRQKHLGNYCSKYCNTILSIFTVANDIAILFSENTVTALLFIDIANNPGDVIIC